ncbi:SusC/RagA family TonB-linked outer membrane protein [Parapedobacter sp. SGR-10]|uniref:SusC/RagA family TonB-linked outer membrane protein n=1 Tax=Parapedobacter sp. SGR-10 TaxID=2710879 RepID=UPI0013CF40F4|nr:SusC/RagA family TonB-linked outer membrane protein [Parapedobacter sp. SGR-10]NGF55915.1 SusC/RagA family TonB-linked outer membrane protein [Parapedobacter sp. SGR-10]
MRKVQCIGTALSGAVGRFFCLSLLTFLLHLQTVSAHQQVISISFNNLTIKEVFKELNQRTGLKFIYSPLDLNDSKKVTGTFKNVPLEKVMERVLADLKVSYTIRDNTVIIKKAQQERILQGRVVDDKSMPIQAVVVKTNASNQTVATDVNGHFSIPIDNEDTELVFSMLGFGKETIKIGVNTEYTVQLMPSVESLNEIVVVGYGVQKRSDITGAISSVTTEQINKMPTTSINEMLRGAAPGVQVTMGSAAPGGSSNILIRGRRSLSAGNDPLYVVDGVPMASIDDINANEVASIEILKDASAQSIYGARAANGVILVTTKRGISGETKVNVNSYGGVQNLYRNFEFYDGEQWAAYRKEAFYNAYGYYNESEAFRGLMQKVYHSKDYVDWEDVMLSPSWQNKNDVLIQSGNEKTKYALSLGHFYQDGIVPSSDFKRFTGRLNIDQKLSEKITLGSNIAYTKSFRTIADGTFSSFITMPPLAEVYKDDGSLREDVTEAGESHYNPLWNNMNAKNDNITDRLNFNFFADWKIVKGLSYRLNTSLNTRKVQENSYLGINHFTGRNNGGRATLGESTYTDYLVENILNYTKDFGVHHIDGTAMASLNGIQWKRIANTGFGFPNDDLYYHAIASADEYAIPVYEFSDRKLLSYLMRARYNYDSRYLFTAAIRVDGSSVFGANNKYGYFPSVAFAWRAKQEAFLKDVGFLSDLKLRLSYGQVGNQAISPYTTLGLATRYLTEFGEESAIGYLPNTELTNPNLKWETSTSTNIGLDYGFFKGRVTGALELYDTQTTDLLVERSLPTTSGYVSQLINLGHVQNRGVELAINTIAIDRNDFTWNVGVNFTANRNKIKKIDGKLDEEGNPANDLNNNWFIGQSMNVYYDYHFDGIWQLDDDIANSHMPTATPGSIRVRDINGDNVISVDDREIIPRDPKFITSFITSFDYKNFNLSLDVYYLAGGYLYNSYLTAFGNGGDLTGKRNGLRRNYWTTNNPSNEAPAPNFIQPPAYLSSLGYEKADYIRLRNISLGYTFPANVVKGIGVESLRLFTTMSNVWTWTEVQGYGPEQNPGAYPEPRTWLFGLNFSF